MLQNVTFMIKEEEKLYVFFKINLLTIVAKVSILNVWVRKVLSKPLKK